MTAQPNQADRIAEAKHEGFLEGEAAYAEYLAGRFDHTAGVQAFAAHRLQAEATQAAEIERLHDALARIAGKNDLSGVAEEDVEAAARGAMYECELIARAALSEPEARG